MTDHNPDVVERRPGVADMLTLFQPCNAPAPLVLTGSPYVECSLPKGHEGQHKIEVRWGA